MNSSTNSQTLPTQVTDPPTTARSNEETKPGSLAPTSTSTMSSLTPANKPQPQPQPQPKPNPKPTEPKTAHPGPERPQNTCHCDNGMCCLCVVNDNSSTTTTNVARPEVSDDLRHGWRCCFDDCLNCLSDGMCAGCGHRRCYMCENV